MPRRRILIGVMLTGLLTQWQGGRTVEGHRLKGLAGCLSGRVVGKKKKKKLTNSRDDCSHEGLIPWSRTLQCLTQKPVPVLGSFGTRLQTIVELILFLFII